MPDSTPLSLLRAIFSLFLALPFLHRHGNSQPTSNPELSILLDLKQQWSNPPSLAHWTPSSNPCTWPEISCTGGAVAGITLSNINLTQPIPPSICDLTSIAHIDLSFNFIPGPFPTSLYNCSSLQYLDLSQNYFVGLLPESISRLSPELRHLDLGANNFTGDIPASIALLSNLTTLHLYQNLFNGSFPPEIGNLSNLENLGLAFNGFWPSRIPESFSRLNKLKQLWMTEMNLIGEIPVTITQLTSLEMLDLSVNELSGSIPTGLFLLKNLSFVYLYRNTLTGEIPQSIEAWGMEVIDLSANNLMGKIPGGFGNLTKLSSLVLFYNQLSGEIPASVGQLPLLTDLRIFSNNFSGELPPDFGRFSKLQKFEVASNQFNGTLPANLCYNGVLLGLVVFENHLSGEIPPSLGYCNSLMIFRVHGNQFSGEIPDGLWRLLNLTTMMVSDNSFSGELPTELASNLSTLEISNNRFSGRIPVGSSSWMSLRVFRASNNLLNGTVPQELTALPLLATLLLDRNQLSGDLPSEILSWASLSTLNLSRNLLSGQIPAGLGYLSDLNVLDLSENQFSGQIPLDLVHLTLTFLNLSSNRLTGAIPAEFENGAFDGSFSNNLGLCSTNPSTMGLHSCHSQAQKNRKFSSKLMALFGSLGIVIAILVTSFAIIRLWKRNWSSSNWTLTSFHKLNFKKSDILPQLTESNVTGRGSSGKVYRVLINRGGECVAVKKLYEMKLDQKLQKEFLSEVRVLGTIRHANIVKLFCCISSEDSKLLVYEYFENGSLDSWLHRKRNWPGPLGLVSNAGLDWPKRVRIAAGAARGLCYMHHDCSPPIVHRDVKSSNVLLDNEFNAKIADFGLARFLDNLDEPNTLSTVAGSFGYFAPEYAYTTKVNEKVDVYSFGVILLELTTGREASEGDGNSSLAEWAWKLVQEGKAIVDLLDQEIKDAQYEDEMSSVFKLGLICTSTLPSSRPTMKEVSQLLVRYSSARAPLEKKKYGGDNDDSPLLKDSKREII